MRAFASMPESLSCAMSAVWLFGPKSFMNMSVGPAVSMT